MSNNITHATRLTVLKHLAAGKGVEVVGAIMKLSRFEIIDIASEHGYPDVAKMAQAVTDITRNIESAERDELAHRPHAGTETVTARPVPRPSAVPTPPPAPRPAPPAAAARPTAASPAPVTPAASNGTQEGPQVLTQPDELRAVINAGKQSSSKRVQALTNRILDELGRLKEAIHAEQAKAEAARRKAAQKAAAARARAAEREALQKKKAELESELAEVKAKLRGGPTKTPAAKKPAANTAAGSPAAGSAEETPAKEIRAWAREVGLDVPDAGRVPQKVREAYAAAHASEQAA